MPGLVPGIHVFDQAHKDVDGRVKPGHDESRDRYQPRVAAASQPNTLKMKGFRSRLYTLVSSAATLSFSHASAMRASRAGSAPGTVTRALSQSRTASTNAVNAISSL